jgi:hypothetical protein
VEYYEWMSTVEFPKTDLLYSPFEEPYGPVSLEDLEEYTEYERKEQQYMIEDGMDYKLGGFLEGFFVVSKWSNSSYFVIDTLGTLGTKGAIISLDLDWGNNAEAYFVRFASFENFLKAVLELLKQKICTNPAIISPDGKITHLIPSNKWFSKEMLEEQRAIIRQINPEQFRIDWETGEKKIL